MVSKLSEEELKAIDMVIGTFGLYSPKTLEKISHSHFVVMAQSPTYTPASGDDYRDISVVYHRTMVKPTLSQIFHIVLKNLRWYLVDFIDYIMP